MLGQGALKPEGKPGPMFRTLQEVQPRTPLRSNGVQPIQITKPGAYVLSADVEVMGPQGIGIEVLTGGVDIDLNGQYIKCSNASIRIAEGIVTIRNGRLEADDCISSTSSAETTLILSEVTLQGLSGISDIANVRASNCVFATVDFGLVTRPYVGTNVLQNCTFYGNNGIHVMDTGLSVVGCTFKTTEWGISGSLDTGLVRIATSDFHNITSPVSLSSSLYQSRSAVIIESCNISTSEPSFPGAISLKRIGSVNLVNSTVTSQGQETLLIDEVDSVQLRGCTIRQKNNSRFSNNRTVSISDTTFAVLPDSSVGNVEMDACRDVQLKNVTLSAMHSSTLYCYGGDRLTIDGFTTPLEGENAISVASTRSVQISDAHCSNISLTGGIGARLNSCVIGNVVGGTLEYTGEGERSVLVAESVQARVINVAAALRGSLMQCTAKNVQFSNSCRQLSVVDSTIESLNAAGKGHRISANNLQNLTVAATYSTIEDNTVEFGCSVTGTATLVRRNRAGTFSLAGSCISAGVVKAQDYEAAPVPEVNISN